jgi:peptidoglycan/xylan/chitin deacetylase (PgdA/CDA1 family)
MLSAARFLPKIRHLTLHGVGPLPSRPVDEAERRFWTRADVLSRLLDLMQTDPNLEISFDDGNVSDLYVAAPMLAKRGLSATFFVLTGRMGERDFLSGEEIRALDALGMTIGSHGINHPRYTTLNDAKLDEELLRSRARLEDLLGKPVRRFAFPYGDFDARTLRRSLESGYDLVFTASGGLASAAMRVVPRTSIENDTIPDTALRLKDRIASGLRNHARLLKYGVADLN